MYFLTFVKFVSENVNFLALNICSGFSSISLRKSVNANLDSNLSLPSLKLPESPSYIHH